MLNSQPFQKPVFDVSYAPEGESPCTVGDLFDVSTWWVLYTVQQALSTNSSVAY